MTQRDWLIVCVDAALGAQQGDGVLSNLYTAERKDRSRHSFSRQMSDTHSRASRWASGRPANCDSGAGGGVCSSTSDWRIRSWMTVCSTTTCNSIQR